MMGLAYLVFFGVYALISVAVVTWAIRHARAERKNPKLWGWGAALVMWLILFWDWIPTVATHQYYCATEAGFWVYKTPEQWMKENPGVTLASAKGGSTERQEDDSGYTEVRRLNRRFDWVVKNHHSLAVLRVDKKEELLIDRDNKDVLARYVDFSSGYGNPMTHSSSNHQFNRFKSWLAREMCDTTGTQKNSFENQISQIYAYEKGGGR